MAGQAVHALARGTDSRMARVGALMVAEFFATVRHALKAP